MNFTITWIMDRLGFVPKASALAKLTALGLSEDEVKALVG